MPKAAPYIYNAQSWTAEQFVADIKLKASMPASSDYTDEKILEVGNEAIWSTLSLPEVTNNGNNWGQSFTHVINGTYGAEGGTGPYEVTSNRTPGSWAGNGQEYELPPAVSAGTIQFVTYKQGNSEHALQHIPHSDFFKLWLEDQSSGTPWAYTIWENKLKVLPRASTSLSGTFQIYYVRRHPQVMLFADNFMNIDRFYPLVNLSEATGYTESNLPGYPPTWWPKEAGFIPDYSTGEAGESTSLPFPFRWDIVQQNTPYSPRVVDMDYLYTTYDDSSKYRVYVNHDIYPLEQIIPGVSGADPSPALDVKRNPVGTFTLCASGTSPYVHLTHELREAAATQAAAIILRNIGSIEEAAAYDNKVARLIAGVQNQMTPRVKSAPLKVTNHQSIMRSISRSGRNRGRRY